LFKEKTNKNKEIRCVSEDFHIRRKNTTSYREYTQYFPFGFLVRDIFTQELGVGKMVWIGQTEPKLYAIPRRRMFVQRKNE